MASNCQERQGDHTRRRFIIPFAFRFLAGTPPPVKTIGPDDRNKKLVWLRDAGPLQRNLLIYVYRLRS